MSRDRPTNTWAPWSPVREKKIGRESVVARREAHSRVLSDLREEEREAHEKRQHEARLESCPVAALDRLEGPVHREARRDEDDGVDTRHEHRQVIALGRPRVAVNDADEEVRGEERPEEHDLRADEEQHSEHTRIHARRDVRGGRMLAVGVVVCRGGVRFHYAVTSAGTGSD